MSIHADSITILPLEKKPDSSIVVPGSKSVTNRALILASLAQGRSLLSGALDSEDTRVMISALRLLGIEIECQEQGVQLVVSGTGGKIHPGPVSLFLGNSGTSIRFLTALCSLGSGRYRLDGVERMRQRPQADLLQALRGLGVDAYSDAGNGRPPVVIDANGLLKGGSARLNANASSQFLTSLLMIAPYAEGDVTIEIDGSLRPFYVEITRKMMTDWGVKTEVSGNTFYVRSGQRYLCQPRYSIEPDASSASYFFAAAAITGGRVQVPGLSSKAMQGDVRFAAEILAQMGCIVSEDANGITVEGPPSGELRGIDRDMSSISDTSLTLAAIAPFASTPTTIRNIAHTRLQECDRISAVCRELTRLGVAADEREDGFTVYPAKNIHPAEIETYRDHRIAMSFALIGLKAPGITILDPGCTAKTFPGFWQLLDELR